MLADGILVPLLAEFGRLLLLTGSASLITDLGVINFLLSRGLLLLLAFLRFGSLLGSLLGILFPLFNSLLSSVNFLIDGKNQGVRLEELLEVLRVELIAKTGSRSMILLDDLKDLFTVEKLSVNDLSLGEQVEQLRDVEGQILLEFEPYVIGALGEVSEHLLELGIVLLKDSCGDLHVFLDKKLEQTN